MALTLRSRLGVYEITAQIGEGGMGQVFRATDTKLKRQVAIKILPPSVAADVERLARFQREAEVLASLNHPNIAGIYGLEESGGSTALVMELVEGHDLSQRIARGAIPIDEALPIAKQIAEALEAAHEQGIIHRDLKPANIKLRADGTVKVLDFGLAKAIDATGAPSANASMSPTMMSPAQMSGVGMLLGTAAYMAPEQARGRAVDRRADIWAFGVVVFEMLTGGRAFAGDDISITLASVLKDDVNWTALPANTPPHVLSLLRRCLQKDPQKRLPHIGVARLDIEEASTTSAGPSLPTSRRRSPIAWTVAAAFGLVAIMALAALWTLVRGASTAIAPGAIRANVSLPDQVLPLQFEVSPDGRRVAFVQRTAISRQIAILDLATSAVTPVRDSDQGAGPFWSPDGRSVGFFTGGKLKTVALAGGAPVTVADMPGVGGAAWAPDGAIVFAAAGGIFAASHGGAARRLTAVDKSKGELLHVWPRFLPDGRRFFYTAQTEDGELTTVYVSSIDGAPSKIVVAAASAAYVDGRLLFVRDSKLLVQPSDSKTLELTGAPALLANQVAVGGSIPSIPRRPAFSASASGVVLFRETDPTGHRQLVEYDRSGRALRVFGEPGRYANPALSPDEKRLAVSRVDSSDKLSGQNVFLLQLDRNTMTRLTFGTGESDPAWSPDGKRVAFSSIRDGKPGLYVKDATAGGEETRLLESDVVVYPDDWSPDGSTLLYTRLDPKTTRDLWMLSLADGKSSLWLQTPASDDMAVFSPDGRFVAYVSAGDVYIRNRDGSGGKWQVSTRGGRQPRWRGDGKELFFASADGAELFSTALISTSPIELDTPRKLFDLHLPDISRSQWVASKDGQRFIVETVREDSAVPSLNLIANWPALLTR